MTHKTVIERRDHNVSSAYRPRLLDARIKQKLRSSGGVLLGGARQVGKTIAATHHAASQVRLDETAAYEMVGG